MQFFYNLTTLFSIIGLSSIHQEFAKIFQDICISTAAEQEIRTFLYTTNVKSIDDHLHIPAILQKPRAQNPIAVINIDSLTPIERYTAKFNHNLISIVQLTQNASSNGQLFQILWQRLHLNIQSGLILLFDNKASDKYVSNVLKLCAESRAINVIALKPEMAVKDRSYWTLQIFPIQQTIKLNFPAFYQGMFPKHMENMHGHKFPVLGNILVPHFYNYIPKHGPTTISGFMGRALAEYAHRHNGSIDYSLSTDYMFLSSDLGDKVINTTAIVGELWPMQFTHSNFSLSNAVHNVDICLMIPLEKGLPKLSFYYAIVSKIVLIAFLFSFVFISFVCALTTRLKTGRQVPLIEYFVKFSVLQGLLGTPFCTNGYTSRVHKAICITISLSGIIIGTAYGTYLQSFSVNAPITSPIKTIDDIFKRGLKIPILTNTINTLRTVPHFESYIDNFTIFSNLSEILSLQDTLDTRYAFLVDDMWRIYNVAQKYFSKPLFRLSDICLWNNMPLALPLPENSEYRRSLNEFILRLHEVGLIKHWLEHTIVELLDMDLIKFEDRNKHPAFEPLKLEDLRMVLIAMGVLEMCNIICFLIEVFWVKIRNSTKKFIRILMNIKM